MADKTFPEYPNVTLWVGKVQIPLRWLKFSAGEVQVRIEDVATVEASDSVMIRANLCDSDATMTLFMLIGALSELDGPRDICLDIPYLPFSRQDRVVYPGECFALQSFWKLLFALLENGFSGWEVITLDAHSHVSETIIDQLGWWTEGYRNIPPGRILEGFPGLADYGAVVAPDKGAAERAANVITEAVPGAAFIQMGKERDPNTGYLSIFKIETDISQFDKSLPLLIVDDICDGGRTFIGAEKALRDAGWSGVISLYVSHGIFSAGCEKLSETFKEVIVGNLVVDQVLPDNFRVVNEFLPMYEA